MQKIAFSRPTSVFDDDNDPNYYTFISQNSNIKQPNSIEDTHMKMKALFSGILLDKSLQQQSDFFD